MTTMSTLIRQRQELFAAVNACRPGAFPGSAEWRKESAAMAALDAFDSQHPTLLPTLQAFKRLAAQKSVNDFLATN